MPFVFLNDERRADCEGKENTENTKRRKGCRIKQRHAKDCQQEQGGNQEGVFFEEGEHGKEPLFVEGGRDLAFSIMKTLRDSQPAIKVNNVNRIIFVRFSQMANSTVFKRYNI